MNEIEHIKSAVEELANDGRGVLEETALFKLMLMDFNPDAGTCRTFCTRKNGTYESAEWSFDPTGIDDSWRYFPTAEGWKVTRRYNDKPQPARRG